MGGGASKASAEADTIFKSIDTNKNRKLSVQELAAAVKQRGIKTKWSDSSIREVIAKHDKNGDGDLDMKEWRAALSALHKLEQEPYELEQEPYELKQEPQPDQKPKPSQPKPNKPKPHRKPVRTPCKYGAKCYQQSPKHRSQYSHPGDPDYPAVATVRAAAASTVPHTFIRISPSGAVAGTAVVRINIVDPLLRLDAKGALRSGNLPVLPPPPAHVLTPAVYEEIVEPGGMANVGYALQQENARRRIGTMIAGNSGRPGGACGQADGTVSHLHANHTTQEEDMVSNWLLTVTHLPQRRSAVYRATLHNRWGMIHPEATNHETIQGVDYAQADAGDLYADAWCVDGACVSAKVVGDRTLRKSNRFDTGLQFKTSLVFVAGPNVGAHGDSGVSTTRRTFNMHMEVEYSLFRRGVQAAVHAGLLAMAQMGVDIALLAHVSSGIYAGPHQHAIRHDFGDLVDEVLRDERQLPAPLGCYFERVVLAKLL